jgi:hypothetical protein
MRDNKDALQLMVFFLALARGVKTHNTKFVSA